MNVDDLLGEYLDDDRPTTPGEMRWVECDCQFLGRFPPVSPVAMECEVCKGHGYKLITVERTS